MTSWQMFKREPFTFILAMFAMVTWNTLSWWAERPAWLRGTVHGAAFLAFLYWVVKDNDIGWMIRGCLWELQHLIRELC